MQFQLNCNKTNLLINSVDNIQSQSNKRIIELEVRLRETLGHNYKKILLDTKESIDKMNNNLSNQIQDQNIQIKC